LSVKPLLQVNWQLLPEVRVDEQVPSVPFAGAVTEHEVAVHVCGVRTPAEQVVAAPLSM
jgi:hypothetical protein